MSSSADPARRTVSRSARARGIIALVFAAGSGIGVLATLDLWKQTVAPGMLSLPSNIALTAAFVVAAARAFAIARRGGHTESSAATDRILAVVGLLVVFAIVFSALTAAGTGALVGLLLYAVGLSAVLEALLILNWKAPSLTGPLSAHRPVGERPR